MKAVAKNAVASDNESVGAGEREAYAQSMK